MHTTPQLYLIISHPEHDLQDSNLTEVAHRKDGDGGVRGTGPTGSTPKPTAKRKGHASRYQARPTSVNSTTPQLYLVISHPEHDARRNRERRRL